MSVKQKIRAKAPRRRRPLLHRATFARFLRLYPAATFRRNSINTCPIACALRMQHPRAIVGATFAEHVPGLLGQAPLPRWAQQFIRRIWRLDHGAITGREALRILNRIPR